MVIQDQASVHRILRIHRIISRELAHYWEQILDCFWLQEKAIEKALITIENLDELLNSTSVRWQDYHDNQAILIALIKELKLESSLQKKLIEQTGNDDFLKTDILINIK